MRKLLIDYDFIAKDSLPTYYKIQKLCPKVEEFVVKSQCIYCDDPTASDTQSTDDQVVAAKLHGSYPDHVNILSKRCKRKLQDDSANMYNEKEIVLDSYNGAHHTNNVKKKKEYHIFQLTATQRTNCPPNRIVCGECQYLNMDAGTRPGKGRNSLPFTKGCVQKQISTFNHRW